MDEHIVIDTDNGDSDHNSVVSDDNPVITSDNNDDDSSISSDEDTIFSDLILRMTHPLLSVMIPMGMVLHLVTTTWIALKQLFLLIIIL